MSNTRVSIGQVKRDISDLVNRVAYGSERIVLTSRGKPKAALVSIEDCQRLEQDQIDQARVRWQVWQAESQALAADILERRGGEPMDLDGLWEDVRADREARDDQVIGR
jgi:prevent-host-death family protein